MKPAYRLGLQMLMDRLLCEEEFGSESDHHDPYHESHDEYSASAQENRVSVLLIGTNCPEWIICELACFQRGYITVPNF